MEKELISISNCKIQKGSDVLLSKIDWKMQERDAWLVIGANGSGKEDFIQALGRGKSSVGSSSLDFIPNQDNGFYTNIFLKKTSYVSLEVAAKLIEEERERDESEYLDSPDIGRTGRAYICEVLGGSSKKNAPLPEIAGRLETLPEVKLCGVDKILDRGLSFMSTGEIRRTLLCRSLLSGSELIILSDPFAGLDAESRRILKEFFGTVLKRQNEKNESGFPKIILCMERYQEIPDGINRVIEFSDRKVSFSGTRKEYEAFLSKANIEKKSEREKEREEFLLELKKIFNESLSFSEKADSLNESLIRFENVNVGWGDNHVLVDLNWEVKKGEHFLIRGPNGSGKTTIMELITGDNMQVFREKVFLFGKRRGSGETIWDIKKKLGIVGYRLHVEYRMLGGTDLQSVIVSGFKDSIGLYESASDVELSSSRAWLKLAGFQGREKETFGSLSYGEQRAILILRAAVKRPLVLILDEPCHGLDENNRAKILDLLETIAETGTTTLLHVTHDPEEVLPCEKNILELHPGENPMYKILLK